ncbi:hypothetical protein [Streptomyces sp. NBC_01373]|uniref:hypothetical protein n=1 Tax=Streptomyces sp. NBC_01373 TaxID=2903843 RepID=UPI0022531E49|nr:hypothetical protein [Streptomyces sp. NBC_01373]MCX4697057.1 hypothetical protein [Streptomyces sp. NBC_01373]MCX4707018.1 hypothetical protein [Streptomyces sp. NBC_01373]
MMHADTRLLNQTLALGNNPDDIRFVEQDGHGFLILGNVSLALSMSSQAALDKLATATAEAAAERRAHNLREVA